MSDIKRIGGSTNAIIIQLPERKLPAIAIQHDSLNNLLNLVKETKKCMLNNDWDETRGVLNELDGIISGYLAAFNIRK